SYSALPTSVCSLFSNHPATTEIYTLSLHDALPISLWRLRELKVDADVQLINGDLTDLSSVIRAVETSRADEVYNLGAQSFVGSSDRKSTRLNSSHVKISYAVFCLKKKNKKQHKQNN